MAGQTGFGKSKERYMRNLLKKESGKLAICQIPGEKKDQCQEFSSLKF